MNDLDVQNLFAENINGMNGEKLDNLIIWFNRTSFDEILTVFNQDKNRLRILESIVSFPVEIGIDTQKLELLREYLD
ncbi:hypothetical protein [Rodentibacter ratti]|uniref:Uncharacterized protein n=1 Tax=Rodentibacter ratti TaxID=1906745 RepID=A0A1V3L8G3_9PAST|nr:hypothetical protein [Rodentibacter ratti]OOF86222.1 hypothetical protein BKG88_05125 [Rodentibacter ratti]